MAGKIHERTFKMRENFIELHDKGYSIPQIAKMYGLSTQTIYNSLQEIADESGRTRESLLEVPHGAHLTYDRQFEPVAEVDLTGFEEKFKTAIEGFNSVCESVKATIEKQEVIAQKIEEEQKEWITA